MGVQVRNVNAETDISALEIPRRPDGTYYRYEMVISGGWERVYDDTAADLMNYLIPGYTTLTEQERITARVRHAVDTQVRLQAIINSNVDGQTTEQEHVLLHGPRHIQPTISEWSNAIPIVLIDTFYHPYTETPKPLEVSDGEIWWLIAGEGDFEYLRSLHDLAVIDLNLTKDEVL